MSGPTPMRPADFSRQLLGAMDASEGRRKRRKRDTTPDALGLSIQRALLTRAISDDPDPEDFEAWLLAQVLDTPTGSGPVRALCRQILDEYELARFDPTFRHWLAEGAPSADAEGERGEKGEGRGARRERRGD